MNEERKEVSQRKEINRVLAAIKVFPDLTTWRFPIYKFVGPERRSEKNGS